MQTNVSAELRDSIYPLSNYINRSWIVTNGSWRGRREKQHTMRSWRGPRCMIAFFHPISLSHSSLPRSLPVLLLEIPPQQSQTSTHVHTNIRTRTLSPTSLFPAWKTFILQNTSCFFFFFLAIMQRGINVCIIALSISPLQFQYWRCTQSLNQNKAVSGPRATLRR